MTYSTFQTVYLSRLIRKDTVKKKQAETTKKLKAIIKILVVLSIIEWTALVLYFLGGILKWGKATTYLGGSVTGFHLHILVFIFNRLAFIVVKKKKQPVAVLRDEPAPDTYGNTAPDLQKTE